MSIRKILIAVCGQKAQSYPQVKRHSGYYPEFVLVHHWLNPKAVLTSFFLKKSKRKWRVKSDKPLSRLDAALLVLLISCLSPFSLTTCPLRNALKHPIMWFEVQIPGRSVFRPCGGVQTIVPGLAMVDSFGWPILPWSVGSWIVLFSCFITFIYRAQWLLLWELLGVGLVTGDWLDWTKYTCTRSLTLRLNMNSCPRQKCTEITFWTP